MTAPLVPSDYRNFLTEVKRLVQTARLEAGRAVNRQLVLLYWDIGRGIVEKQTNAGWGEAVVKRFAVDLRAEFPDMKGFSARSVWEMKRFFLAFTGPELLQHAVAVIPPVGTQGLEDVQRSVLELVLAVPWGHHVLLQNKIKDPSALLYYVRATARFGWSRNVLLNQIKAAAYERAVKEEKTHNFGLALPKDLAEQADEMLKSRYNLEFLGLKRAIKERELETRLIEHLQHFILELGYGFCFVGRQYRLALGTKEYFVDLLFYHRFLKALVAFDLKIGEFEPEHVGKMDFYLNLLNEKERAADDRPSIGVILCAEKNDVEVEFALKTKGNPIGVAEYCLQGDVPMEFRGKLPTAKQLVDAVREALPGDYGSPRPKTWEAEEE